MDNPSDKLLVAVRCNSTIPDSEVVEAPLAAGETNFRAYRERTRSAPEAVASLLKYINM